ncbi:hypothetical protein FGG78_12955 [Thioclava sp. BHET1]|nr:hypothetical protein FGG78_12955 [Thioclava sp. BHET1]
MIWLTFITWTTGAAVFFWVAILQLRSMRSFCSCNPGLVKLKHRLVAYSSLSNEEVCGDENGHGAFLDGNAHAILLGTLKKVETKSATLASIIVFILGFSLASVVAILVAVVALDSKSAKTYELLRPILASVSFAGLVSLLPLYWSLAGIKQIDQHDFLMLSSASREREMQKALMRDLLKKESRFRFSTWLVFGISAFVIIVVFSTAMKTLSSEWPIL